MRVAVRSVALLCVSMIALGACGGSSSSDANVTDAKEVAAKLKCSDSYAEESDEGSVDMGPKPISKGTCTVDGEEVKINVYKDEGVRKNAEGLGKTVGCAFASGFGVTNFSYVTTANWSATPDSETVNKELAKRTGLEPQTVKCEKKD